MKISFTELIAILPATLSIWKTIMRQTLPWVKLLNKNSKLVLKIFTKYDSVANEDSFNYI